MERGRSRPTSVGSALRIAKATKDVQGECEALTGLARVALREGRHEDVVALALEGRARAKDGGYRAAEAAPVACSSLVWSDITDTVQRTIAAGPVVVGVGHRLILFVTFIRDLAGGPRVRLRLRLNMEFGLGEVCVRPVDLRP
jgi:hypothetical protein